MKEWRIEFLYKKWPNMIEELVYGKIICCTDRTCIRNMENIYMVKCNRERNVEENGKLDRKENVEKHGCERDCTL